MIIKKLCGVCQTEFEATQEIIDRGRGKFCSMPCYRISRKGQPAWNKGKPATWAIGNKHRSGLKNPYLSALNQSRTKSKNWKWKGKKVSYYGIHLWVKRQLGQPDTCSSCKKSGLSGRKIHWANKSGKYLRGNYDWIRLCAKCHWAYDREHNLRRRKIPKGI